MIAKPLPCSAEPPRLTAGALSLPPGLSLKGVKPARPEPPPAAPPTPPAVHTPLPNGAHKCLLPSCDKPALKGRNVCGTCRRRMQRERNREKEEPK